MQIVTDEVEEDGDELELNMKKAVAHPLGMGQQLQEGVHLVKGEIARKSSGGRRKSS